jgi:hypothetical protein
MDFTMMRPVEATRTFIWLAGLALGISASASEPRRDAETKPASTTAVVGSSTPVIPRDRGAILPDLALLTPGTQVDRKMPAGWSHLVLKSLPRLASGDLNTLPGMATSTATMFHTVILADVRPTGVEADRRFVLRRIGLGLCVPVRGQDTVVMSKSVSAQGIDLGMVGRTVLERAEQELRRGRIVTRTPTFALFSAPAVMCIGTAHRDVLLRYAFLVDPQTGALRTFAWAIAAEPELRKPVQTMVQLTPGVTYDCGLDVAADRIFGTVPVSWSFAIRNLPGGQTRPVPAEFQHWSIREARTPLEADQMEESLRLAFSPRPGPSER